jgi:RNA polymerase sigma-70 factor (ECF subfamily)
MADIAMKRVAQRGPTIREQLKGMDDADVVASFLDGEERAFQELVERYQTRLLNFIYRTIGDREKARISSRGVHPGLPASAPLRPVQEVLDVGIHDRVESGQERAAQPLAEPARVVPDMKGSWEDEIALSVRGHDGASGRSLPQASPARAGRGDGREAAGAPSEVFVLRELEGKSYEEIAEITDCNLGTVKSRLNRARNAFAEIIEPWVD